MKELLTAAAILAGATVGAWADSASMTTPIILEAALMQQMAERFTACDTELFSHPPEYSYPPLREDATPEEAAAALEKAEAKYEVETKTWGAKRRECDAAFIKTVEGRNNLEKLCRVYPLLTLAHDAPATSADLKAMDICKQVQELKAEADKK